MRIDIGRIGVDVVDSQAALDRIAGLVEGREGGNVFTPNVDHVVQAEVNEAFRDAYTASALRLADGMPVVWASRLLGTPLPERVAGSDLFAPLMAKAAHHGWRVFLLGALPGVAEEAAAKLQAQGVNVVGIENGHIPDPRDPAARAPITARIRAARTELLVVALGAPKQELWMHAARAELGGAVAIGLGATLDFFVGRSKRAPRWMARAGLEWLYRLASEPRRLWRRYLMRDPAFAWIVLRGWLARRKRRASPQVPAS